MPQSFQSAYFGVLPIDSRAVTEFPAGLPGFESMRRFTMLEYPDQPELIFLQSLERADLCFLMMPVETLRPEYPLAVSSDDLGVLGANDATALRAFAVLSLVEGEEATANLLAPVV